MAEAESRDPLERILGASFSLGRMIGSGRDDPNAVPFEEYAIALGSQIAHVAESFYLPFLRAMLGITRLDRDASSALPHEIGAILNLSRQEWTGHYPGLLPLLDDRVRIVRNSEMHRSTLIDVRTQSVTFINMRKGGKRETLGPLNRRELGEIISSTLRFCLALQAGFRLARRQLSQRR
jgi:hypothetical protein